VYYIFILSHLSYAAVMVLQIDKPRYTDIYATVNGHDLHYFVIKGWGCEWLKHVNIRNITDN